MKYKAKVIKGKGRGKGLGFPTFNLEIPAGFDREKGIYAAQVRIAGKAYPGALHFGPIPVFEEKEVSLEVFVLDYEDEAKVSEVEFEIIQFLRPIRSFPDPEALRIQITDDVAKVRLLTTGLF